MNGTHRSDLGFCHHHPGNQQLEELIWRAEASGGRLHFVTLNSEHLSAFSFRSLKGVVAGVARGVEVNQGLV
jgi:hypothetical protein